MWNVQRRALSALTIKVLMYQNAKRCTILYQQHLSFATFLELSLLKDLKSHTEFVTHIELNSV